MTIELCIFDLDNTLLRTDDLEEFRGRANVNLTSREYTEALLQAAFGPDVENREIYTSEQLLGLRLKFPKMRWGVFTRSPRHYAKTLLDRNYPQVKWDVVIGFEDVVNTKPDPEGIRRASNITAIKSPDRIALIGDDKVDVVCAYRSGCWSFIDQSTWNPRKNGHWWALERVPDALFKGADELESLLRNPYIKLPELEYRISKDNSHDRKLRVDTINHFFPRTYGSGFVPINVMGRLFGDYQDLDLRREWHPLSEQIVSHKNSNSFPDSWLCAIRDFIKDTTINDGEAVVTVIPCKAGRTPRLESLLQQVAGPYDCNQTRPSSPSVEYLHDILEFRSGAVSSHGRHLNADERFNNVGENLYVRRPADIKRRHVIVIDDVVTSGATLLWAHRFLMSAGARRVTCLSLAKAIGPN